MPDRRASVASRSSGVSVSAIANGPSHRPGGKRGTLLTLPFDPHDSSLAPIKRNGRLCREVRIELQPHAVLTSPLHRDHARPTHDVAARVSTDVGDARDDLHTPDCKNPAIPLQH